MEATLKGPSVDEQQRRRDAYNGYKNEHYTATKRIKSAICDTMDGPR